MELLEYQLSKGVRAFSTLRTSEELGKARTLRLWPLPT